MESIISFQSLSDWIYVFLLYKKYPLNKRSPQFRIVWKVTNRNFTHVHRVYFAEGCKIRRKDDMAVGGGGWENMRIEWNQMKNSCFYYIYIVGFPSIQNPQRARKYYRNVDTWMTMKKSLSTNPGIGKICNQTSKPMVDDGCLAQFVVCKCDLRYCILGICTRADRSV